MGGSRKAFELFLKKFSQRIASETRQSDIVARVSDTAFLFLQPMTAAESAFEFAKRICEHFKQHPLTLNEIAVPIKMCAGISSLHTEDDDGSAMLMRADQALNDARKTGQNKVVIFTER
jgi:diguanylate cyclase (GGDEF)-like protein